MKNIFKTTSQTLLIMTLAIMAVVYYFGLQLSVEMKAGALVGFIGGISAIIVMTIAFTAGWLRHQLEPKTGTGSGSTSLHHDEHRERRQREELLHALVHSMASQLGLTMSAKDVGEYIRGVCDAMLGQVPSAQMDAIKVCACGKTDVATKCACRPNPRACVSADAVLHSAGYQADLNAEAEIVSAGLTAPRVTAEQIQALMCSLSWRYEQPEGTTSTFAHAYLGRFYLATGHSACVSPANFDAAKGMKYAREEAERKARDKLWELEGYALYKQLQAA